MSQLTAKQKAQLEHITRCEEEGGDISTYATVHGLSAQAMYQWRSALRKKGQLPPTATAKPSPWIPVVPPPRATGHCQLRFPSGMELEWDQGCCIEALWPVIDRIYAR